MDGAIKGVRMGVEVWEVVVVDFLDPFEGLTEVNLGVEVEEMVVVVVVVVVVVDGVMVVDEAKEDKKVVGVTVVVVDDEDSFKVEVEV